MNSALERWRAGLSQSPHFRGEDLAELEGHLRDSAAALESRGLTGEEAFLVAARRLGNAASLEPEFAKINGREVWLNRVLWMLIGIQGWWVLNGISRLGADAATLGGVMASAQGVGDRLAAGVSPLSIVLLTMVRILFFTGCLAGCWWLVRHKSGSFGPIVEKVLRWPILAGVATLVVFLAWDLAGPLLRWRLLEHHFPHQVFASVSMSIGVAEFVLMLLQTVGLVVLTLLLLRRQIRARLAV